MNLDQEAEQGVKDLEESRRREEEERQRREQELAEAREREEEEREEERRRREAEERARLSGGQYDNSEVVSMAVFTRVVKERISTQSGSKGKGGKGTKIRKWKQFYNVGSSSVVVRYYGKKANWDKMHGGEACMQALADHKMAYRHKKFGWVATAYTDDFDVHKPPRGKPTDKPAKPDKWDYRWKDLIRSIEQNISILEERVLNNPPDYSYWMLREEKERERKKFEVKCKAARYNIPRLKQFLTMVKKWRKQKVRKLTKAQFDSTPMLMNYNFTRKGGYDVEARIWYRKFWELELKCKEFYP